MTAPEWVSAHIYYSGSPEPLLAQAVSPLVRRLRGQGLVDRFFYINYWLGGPHVRLRLRLTHSSANAEVVETVTQAIEAFLTKRPSLLRLAESEDKQSNYQALLRLENFDAALVDGFDDSGSMILEPNNSIRYHAYNPELWRYGGHQALDLSESHFERSSELALRFATLQQFTNRAQILGTGLFLMLSFVRGFHPSPASQVQFFREYESFWVQNFDRGYHYANASQRVLSERAISHAHHAVRLVNELDPLEGTSWAIGWYNHAVELASQIRDLAAEGCVRFEDFDNGNLFLANETEAKARLLTSYVHMTSNRLRLVIPDEVYLARLAAAAIEETGSCA